MPSVSITSARSDTLEVAIGRRWGRAVAAVSVVVAWFASGMLAPTGASFAALWIAGLVLLIPGSAVVAARALRARRVTLARTPGRLMLDGEPVELARVELRLLEWPLVKRPRAYELSLWMLTAGGPIDMPLGRFPTMVQAASLSGELEEFLAQAGVKQPGKVKGP